MQFNSPITRHVNKGIPEDILGKLFRAIPGCTGGERRAFEQLAGIVNQSAFLTVKPIWEQPSYWSKPITDTRIRTVAPTFGAWVDFLEHKTTGLTSAVIKSYVSTVEGEANTSGIEFRLKLNDGILPEVQFVPGEEKNKTGPNDYPVVYRPLPIVLDNEARLTLQVRNMGLLDRRVIAAFYGWTWQPYAISGSGSKVGMVDTQLS